VVATKPDRLARSTKYLPTWRRLGVGVVAIRDAVDTTRPVGRLLRTVLAAVAELERETIKERLQTGPGGASSAGTYLGGKSAVLLPPHLRTAVPVRRVYQWCMRTRLGSVGSGSKTTFHIYRRSNIMSPQLVRLIDLADVFDVSHETIRRWAVAGRISAFRLPSGQWRVHRAEFERLLALTGSRP
jgi:hypothetical protein